MSETCRPLLRFADFTVDTGARTLHKFGRRLKLHRQPFEILLLLLSRAGEVITRDELQAKLWPKDTFVDFENSLNAAVKKLRQTIGDSASHPRFIETVPRIGYRFMAPVEVQAPSPLPPPPAKVPLQPASPSAASPRFLARWKWWVGIAAAACLVLLAVAAAYFLHFRRQAGTASVETRTTMLAVLPFENLTGDATQDYLSDGLTEELTTQLEQAAPQQFGVIAPTSVMQYRGSPGQLDAIARRLGVEYILEGGLRRDSQHVRITTQLIRIQDRKIVWARQYDRQLQGLLAVQTEIAQEIADEIQIALGRRRSPPASLRLADTSVPYDAYDLYLRGRYALSTRKSFALATKYFQQAIAKDPNYARAYAALADSYALTSSYYVSPAEEIIPKARAAALRALQLDDRLAEAHTSLALITENYDWDWQTAEKEFRLAIQLDPNYPTAHHWYAEYLMWEGRFDEAFAESARARRLDPLSLIIATDHAAIFYYSRQYPRAIEELRTVLEIDPGFARARTLLILSYAMDGQFGEALNYIQKWRRTRTEDSPELWAAQAYVYGLSGNLVQARDALAKFEQANPQYQSDLLGSLTAYSGTNQTNRVFACLQQALLKHANIMTGLKVDPFFDPLRRDPRFQALLRRVGLAN